MKIAGEDASGLIKDSEKNKEMIGLKEYEVVQMRNELDMNLGLVGNLVHCSVPVSQNEIILFRFPFFVKVNDFVYHLGVGEPTPEGVADEFRVAFEQAQA
nr:serine--tRNA ligase-like [Tanacetum cinerariifolium]